MRPVFVATLLACLAGAATAQVPGTVGPPPDSRMSPGAEGPTIACRLLNFGCKQQPEEPIAAPVDANEKEAAAPPPQKPKRTSKPKAKPKPKPKPKVETPAASGPAE